MEQNEAKRRRIRSGAERSLSIAAKVEAGVPVIFSPIDRTVAKSRDYRACIVSRDEFRRKGTGIPEMLEKHRSQKTIDT